MTDRRYQQRRDQPKLASVNQQGNACQMRDVLDVTKQERHDLCGIVHPPHHNYSKKDQKTLEAIAGKYNHELS